MVLTLGPPCLLIYSSLGYAWRVLGSIENVETLKTLPNTVRLPVQELMHVGSYMAIIFVNSLLEKLVCVERNSSQQTMGEDLGKTHLQPIFFSAHFSWTTLFLPFVSSSASERMARAKANNGRGKDYHILFHLNILELSINRQFRRGIFQFGSRFFFSLQRYEASLEAALILIAKGH